MTETYKSEVSAFIEEFGARIQIAEIESATALWNFDCCMTEGNSKLKLQAKLAANAPAQEVSSFRMLSGLMTDSRYVSLSLMQKRALKECQAFFEKNRAGPGDDARLQLCRHQIDVRVSKLEIEANLYQDYPLSLLTRSRDFGEKTFAESVREIVIARNEVATMRGAENFYQMQMLNSSINFEQLLIMIESLKTALIDISNREYHLPRQRPFSLADMKSPAGGLIEGLHRSARLMGVPEATLEEILSASDLPVRQNKNSGWLAFSINCPFDVRALLNLCITESPRPLHDAWKGAIHEVLGHCVDYKSISPDLPYILRSQEEMTSEGMALLSEALMFEPSWIQHVFAVETNVMRRLLPRIYFTQLKVISSQLCDFIRQVEFEIGMYKDPTQDLDALYLSTQSWFRRGPINSQYNAPGQWALVSHHLSFPAYHHNYFLGTLWAMQIRQALRQRFGDVACEKVAPFIYEVRKNGLLATPDEQILQLTGKPFSADAAVEELHRLLGLLAE